MPKMHVAYMGGDRLIAGARGHQIPTDQPEAKGGADEAPTPVELFVASLLTCIGFYAERYLKRHDIDPHSLQINCTFETTEERPARITDIDVEISPPPGLPRERTEALLRVVDACMVHNTLRQPPEIRVALAPEERAA